MLEIELENNIYILYSCESGSRAWGFASPDSDYDVRFIYKRSLEDYMVLKEFEDTIEYPIQNNLDFNGWDLKKFLLHIYKSNGVMFEWLQSPVVYSDIANFRNVYQEVMIDYFDQRSTMNHYLGLTKRTFLDFGNQAEVKLKKYFYILRPILSARWIHQNNSIPPMEFSKLLVSANLDSAIVGEIVTLQEEKSRSDELKVIPRKEKLEAFVQNEITKYESNLPDRIEVKKDLQKLNSLFLKSILNNEN